MANENNSRFQIVTRTGETITLTKEIVKKYLTDNQDITDSEFTMFFQLCKVNKVNPFLKEAYIIKYGSTPATIVLDYKVLQQIAEDNKAYKGMKHGVIVEKPDGTIEERHGEFKLSNEHLIGGWCEVYRDDRSFPTRVTAMFEEFKGTKKTGELNSNWQTKPCFMICKVAKAQALREAFPNLVGSNVYIREEIDSVDSVTTPNKRIKTTVSNSIIPEENIVDEIPSTNTEVEENSSTEAITESEEK